MQDQHARAVFVLVCSGVLLVLVSCLDNCLRIARTLHCRRPCHVAAAGHTKRVTAAVWGQDSVLVTGSNDKSVRFWKHTPAGVWAEG